ncbi:hypothetical protein AB205_0059490 [Aquarana catesbeiana]|uniref:Uncharacterized protein n=1 Tax=Aquarana catesbeiana TaxID=8400 RepID=A0A2G9S8V5_AQUCT|nr:hypothetical protein AB205_0059490 [Aquarana catesbeiana]
MRDHTSCFSRVVTRDTSLFTDKMILFMHIERCYLLSSLGVVLLCRCPFEKQYIIADSIDCLESILDVY